MKITKRSKDITFTADGDLILNENKGSLDIADLTDDQCLINAIRLRLMSRSLGSGETRGDWRKRPAAGSRIFDFRGAPNDLETHSNIKSEIYRALTSDDLVKASELTIEVIPFSPYSVYVAVFVSSISGNTDGAFLSFNYDLRDNKVIPRNVE
jgi:hypothetical protein